MKSIIVQEIKRAVIRKRDASFWFTLMAVVLTAVMLIVYWKTGISTFTPSLSSKVRILLGINLILGVLLCLIEVKNGKYVFYLLMLWTWLEFLIYEASYISNVVVGIDGNSFSTGFIITAVSGLLACVCALIGAIIQKDEISLADIDDGRKLQ